MPDFGPRWKEIKTVGRGGQGRAFLVTDAQNPSGPQFVAKILSADPKQTARRKRIEEEIEVCKSFDHPNVVRVIDTGNTPKSGFPFFVMPFYAGRSLEDRRMPFGPPDEIFKLFAGICDGVAYVHSKNIVHRDIKPANILLDADGRPVVGDFGLCYRVDAESLTATMEVATPRWFGAPELQNGHLENPSQSADVYSLGKLLYWLFTGKAYAREQEEYEVAGRKLTEILMKRQGIQRESELRSAFAAGTIDDRLIHAGAFVEDIISKTVRYNPTDRIQSAEQLAIKVRQVSARFEAGGRALDMRLPQRCLFCGNGQYYPHEPLPPLEERLAVAQPNPRYPPPDPYKKMRDRAHAFGSLGGGVGSVAPLFLICDYCGNVQEFRLDIAQAAPGNWRP
jgi:serine/threonine protein kinase